MKPKAKTLATRITTEIFENGFGEKADRLMLVGRGERDLGGWGFQPLREAISELLAEEVQKNKQVITRTWLLSCGWVTDTEYKTREVLEQTFAANTAAAFVLQITLRPELGNSVCLITDNGNKQHSTKLPAIYVKRNQLLQLIDGLAADA